MQVTRMEIDVAKPVFEVHGVARHGQVLVRKPLTRANIQAVCAPLPPCRIGMDTCASAHDSAREGSQLGHTVRLMAPQCVRP